MARLTFLLRRGASYYARIRVPLDLADALGKKELTLDDKSDATWRHYTATLERDEQERQRMPTGADIEAAIEVAIEPVQREQIDIDDPASFASILADIAGVKNRRAYDSTRRRVKLAELRKHKKLARWR